MLEGNALGVSLLANCAIVTEKKKQHAFYGLAAWVGLVWFSFNDAHTHCGQFAKGWMALTNFC